MSQLFLRARAQNLIKGFVSKGNFKARSADRDAQTDQARIGAVFEAITEALGAAEYEQAGLRRRVEDVLARSAVTLGNGTDEYLAREPLDSQHQDLFGTEISNGQRRLEELATTITHLKFLKAVALSRFPDITTATAPDREQC